MNKWLYLNILHLSNDGFKIGMITLLPFLAHDLHLNFTSIGILGASSNMVQILLSFPASLIAAKIGGLKTITIGLFFYCMGYILSGFSSNFSMIFLCFLLAGAGFAIFHPIAFALISRWVHPSKRGKVLGNFTAVGDIGTAILPAFIPLLITLHGWRFTTILYGFIILCIGILALTFRPKDEAIHKKQTKHKPFHHLLKTGTFITAHISVVLDSFASQPLIIFLPFLLLKHGYTPAHLSLAIAVFFIGSLIGKSLLGTSTDSLRSYKVFIIAELCMIIAIVALIFAYSFVLILILVTILGALTKGTGPVGLTMVSDAVQSHGDFEKAFGFNSAIVAIASSVAPIFLGHISDIYGVLGSFVAMAFFALLATVPALAFGKMKK